MAFSPKHGCSLCGIVSSAVHTPTHSPVLATFSESPSSQPQVLWRDENFTVYRERANPVSSKGHIVIVFNLHVPSIYNISSSDLPLLVSIRDISFRILSSMQTTSSAPAPTPTSSTYLQGSSPDNIRVGFITPPFYDPKIPVTDHLHAHAFVLPTDGIGWFRKVAFGPLAWYALDDLIAEIREESSNNRIRSGTAKRPIDSVPHAGSRQGTADGVETTEQSIAVVDLEDGEHAPDSPRTPSTATAFLTSRTHHGQLVRA